MQINLGQLSEEQKTELRLLSRARQGLFQGRDGGVAQMGDREWYWWLASQPTEVEQFYRVEISVALEETSRDTPLYTLVAFLSADLQTEAVDGEP